MDDEIREQFKQVGDRFHRIINDIFPRMQTEIVDIRLALAKIDGTLVPLQKTWEAIQHVSLMAATIEKESIERDAVTDKLLATQEVRLTALEKIVWPGVYSVLTMILAAVVGGVLWVVKR